MSKTHSRAVVLVLLMLAASASPLAFTAKADSTIVLSVDSAHMILIPGESVNLSLVIENNGSSIETYSVESSTTGLSNVWSATPTAATVSNVLPTYNATTTIVVQLLESATPSDNGMFTLFVNETDGVATSTIDVYVSVAVVYHPSIDASDVGDNGLLAIQPGQSVDLQLPVSNLGSVTDSYLLSVQEEPDLSGWWTNYTSNNSGSNTTSSLPSWSMSVSDVLIFGNSYTSQNGLSSMVEEMLRSAGSPSNTSDFTAGGKTLAGHWSDVNTSASAQNLSLATGVWDTVVLQDQSQIPGFLRSNSNWIASKNGSVELADRVDTEGGSTMLMMTWGRRSGDATNPILFSNYTVMQDRLEQGYIDYRDNISSQTSADIYIAPVGLAFKHIHDSIIASGGNPQSPTSTFYGLYSSDGSHPSTSGSYLAACVLFSALTGDSPVGLTDNTTMDAALRLTLQQTAAEVVFNGSSEYDYPWETSGAIQSMNQHSAFPPGWEVRWLDDQIEDLSAQNQESSTLRITIPSDALPGTTGVRLHAGSLMGNLSTSTLIVIDVQATYGLQVDFLASTDDFIPGEQTNTTLSITNQGTTESTYSHSLSVLSGPCTVALLTAETTFAIDEVASIPFAVDVGSNGNIGDVCSVRIINTLSEDSSVSFVRDFSFEVDRKVAFTVQGPSGAMLLTPGLEETLEVRVFNTGSETETFSLQIVSNASAHIALTLDTASSVTVASGQSATWTLSALAASGSLGLNERTVSVTHDSLQTLNTTLPFDVQPVLELELSGTLDGRIVVQPGQTSSIDIVIENVGTANVSLTTFTISGLPGGVSAELSDVSSITLASGELYVSQLNVTASAAVTARSDSLTIRLVSNAPDSLLPLELQVIDRSLAQLNANTNQAIAGPSTITNVTIEVTNIGTMQDTFLLSLESGESSTYFELSLSQTSVVLGVGQSETVVLGVRESSTGAPETGLPINIQVTSTLDSDAIDFVLITLFSMDAGADLTILVNDDSSVAGGTIDGTVSVTNTGNSADQFSISAVGLTCTLAESVTLSPGASSSPLAWTCDVSEDALAGTNAFSLRVVSSARSDYVYSEVATYNVEASWDSTSVVSISVDATSLDVPYMGGSSTSVTVTNLANIDITGRLTLLGVGDGVFDIQWNNTAGEKTDLFTLSPGASEIFVVRLNAISTQATSAELKVRALVQVDGSSVDAESSVIDVDLAGKAQPPEGITILGIEIGGDATFKIMAAGYVLFALALLVIKYRTPSSKPISEEDEDEEEEEAEEEKEYALGPNECRMDSNRRITCPSCEARLAVPGGNDPPFRFSCPTCESNIRVVEYGSAPKF
jgi:uncharacterized membrane protein